ncbi:hypothetical protein ScPMuIL_013142 [Solemya velum]
MPMQLFSPCSDGVPSADIITETFPWQPAAGPVKKSSPIKSSRMLDSNFANILQKPFSQKLFLCTFRTCRFKTHSKLELAKHKNQHKHTAASQSSICTSKNESQPRNLMPDSSVIHKPAVAVPEMFDKVMMKTLITSLPPHPYASPAVRCGTSHTDHAEEVLDVSGRPKAGHVNRVVAEKWKMIELSPESGIYIHRMQWESALQRTPTKAASYLMSCLWRKEELRGVTLMGTQGKPQLQSAMVEAIISFCLSMSEGNTKEAEIKRAMRNKITDISRLSRSKYKYVPIADYPEPSWRTGIESSNSDQSSSLPGSSMGVFSTLPDTSSFVQAGMMDTGFELRRQFRQLDCGGDISVIPQTGGTIQQVGLENQRGLSVSSKTPAAIKEETTVDDYN